MIKIKVCPRCHGEGTTKEYPYVAVTHLPEKENVTCELCRGDKQVIEVKSNLRVVYA